MPVTPDSARAEMSGETTMLDDATKERCRRELFETEEDRKSRLDSLRTWVKDHPYLTARTDDNFLLRFIRTAKYSLLTAQQRIEKFCVSRSSLGDGEPKWFENQVLDKDAYDYLKKGFLYQLPGTDDEGRLIIMVKFGALNPKKMDFDMLFRAIYLVFDMLLIDERTQINGINILMDAQGITLSHLKPFTPAVTKRCHGVWQDVYPVRLKAIHYINLPGFFKTFLDVCKPFLKDKYKDRMFYHNKSDASTGIVPRRMLPTELGGEAGPTMDLVDKTMERIKNCGEEYEKLKMCGVDDRKRPREVIEGDCWGMVGSFRKISN
ncbi:alpha-tocopherol transfer protein-like [Lineus longissimus]|uniref:alpha-tocopherol transfer protein-like n=1 Tax=Lineus longissimus TaxID=88925 RepID=UPI002B4C6D8B